MVSISTPVCVNFELRPGAGDIHICWFNFDALAQGNTYIHTNIHTYIHFNRGFALAQGTFLLVIFA